MSQKTLIILGIESSCDDTAAAVLKNHAVLSNIVTNQDVHKLWGGVVPELASRAHQQNIVPVVDAALKKAGVSIDDLDAIAFTRGPGLLGSLIVGTSFAKGLAMSKNIPLIEVNHMQGHVLAHFIENDESKYPTFPFLCLTVSGGHTQIVRVDSHLGLTVIGTTIDDAVGEAYDKTAKLLGLPYPGGPLVDKLAQTGDPKKYSFTKSKMDGLDFSFSGLKSNIIQFLARQTKEGLTPKIEDICASVQYTIMEMLFEKLILASEQAGISQIAIAGGVSANSELRKRLVAEGKNRGWETFIPKFEYCTDNAAMIAITGYYQFLAGDFTKTTVSASARMPLKTN